MDNIINRHAKSPVPVFAVTVLCFLAVFGCRRTGAPSAPVNTMTPDVTLTIAAESTRIAQFQQTVQALYTKTNTLTVTMTPNMTLTITAVAGVISGMAATSTYEAMQTQTYEMSLRSPTPTVTHTMTPDMTGTAQAIGTSVAVQQSQTRTFTPTVTPTNVLWENLGAPGFTSSPVASAPSIFSHNGTILIAYIEGSYPAGTIRLMANNMAYWYTFPYAVSWAGTYPSACVNNNQVIVAYSETVYMNGSKAMAKYMDQNGYYSYMGAPELSTGTATCVNLRIDSGTPYISFVDSGLSGKATVMNYDGTNWQYVGAAGFTPGTAEYASFFIDNGALFLAFTDGDQGGKASVMKYNGVSWEYLGSPGFSSGAATYVTIHGYNGTPYVCYTDGSQGNKLTVMKYNGVDWETTGSAGISAGSAVGSVCVYNGVPYVAMRDGGYGNKARVVRFTGSTWAEVGNIGFSAGPVSYGISIVFNNGIPYVIYPDAAYGNRATVMRYIGQ